MIEKNFRRVEVDIPIELLDKINSLSKGSEKTIGEIVVRIIKDKFEIEGKNFREKLKSEKGL